MADVLKGGHRRFIIYGAGAIGSVFGGMPAREGHQELFFAYKWR